MCILVTVLALLIRCTDTAVSYFSLFLIVWRQGFSLSTWYRQENWVIRIWFLGDAGIFLFSTSSTLAF